MKMKNEKWITRRKFSEAYAKMWKISKPSPDACVRWARAWEKEGLARWVKNSAVGAGGYWEFSHAALDIQPTPRGPKPKKMANFGHTGKLSYKDG